AAGKGALHGVVMRRVVRIVDGGIAIAKFHRMLSIGAVDGHRTTSFLVFPDRPRGNVDMMRSPVREFAAGVLIPPSELIMAALGDVVHPRCLAQPEVPIQLARRV